MDTVNYIADRSGPVRFLRYVAYLYALYVTPLDSVFPKQVSTSAAIRL